MSCKSRIWMQLRGVGGFGSNGV
ncbi:hypothetical protein NC651_032905 [Populus alba x Populus x berolinensis]|nr:hypothetical protein NC651_032904 [Populus alba x Populus x berolinensis]KAJ6874223.1 hypothetical protein NC651_032905 [Populus alba x Populus x berolinensis]